MAETGPNRFVDATAETEVELRLPPDVEMEPDRIRKDVPIYPGAVDLDAVNPDPETHRQFGPPNGAKPKWPRHGLPLPRTSEPHRQLPGAGAQPVGFGYGRHTFGMSSPTYPGLAQPPTECRDTAGEATHQIGLILGYRPGTPESGINSYRDWRHSQSSTGSRMDCPT